MNDEITINKHIEEPEISVNQYIRSRCLELGKTANSKKIVYLDTNFWLILRDVALNRNEDLNSNKLFLNIMELAEAGNTLFPISEDVFLEVIKQTDENTLNQTVELIDNLSKGVSMISFNERFSLEFKYFILSTTGKSTYSCKDLVWTKLIYNMGFITPNNQHIDPKLNKAIQKAFIDHMWHISFSEMIETLKENGGLPKAGMPKLSENLNKGKFEHSDENKSFKKMFLSELAGALDVYSDIIAGCISDIYQAETGNFLSQQDLINPETTRLHRNTIYNLFRLNKSQHYFPTLKITSGLYAAIRWDKNQKFQDNDVHDIRHAASALPYCDAFFTERRLAHLIKQKATNYNKQFSCVVEASVSDAYNALSKLQG